MAESISPQAPFIWPEPKVSEGLASYPGPLPFERVARSAVSIFGVVSAIDSRAIDWMEGYLADNQLTKLRLVISVYPTCRTTEANLVDLLRLVERHGERAAFKVFPETSLVSRSSNLLCLCGPGKAEITIGPTENIGFAAPSPSQGNFVCTITAAAVESCRKWFDYLWAKSGKLRPDVVNMMPHLVLPRGDEEAVYLWDAFRVQCLSDDKEPSLSAHVHVDQQTGDLVLLDENGQELKSPTEEIGVAKLDALADAIAKIFDLGSLVTVDKASRVPPLEAPVKPEWFEVDSFRQTGMVWAKTSFKVAPFDESILKKIDRLRRASGELLPRYSFPLSDGVRWMPKKAIPLFEEALTAANDEALKLLNATVGSDIEAFLQTQFERIRSDAQRMYEVYHPGGQLPDQTVSLIMDELKNRLDKAGSESLLPKVSYASIAFNPGQSTQWSSPWGQAFQLLKNIVEFPRKAMTDRYFLQGSRTDEDALIEAMDVAEDDLVKDYGSRKAKQRAKEELAEIAALEAKMGDTRDKCEALWRMIKGDNRPVVQDGHVQQQKSLFLEVKQATKG